MRMLMFEEDKSYVIGRTNLCLDNFPSPTILI